MTVENHTKQLSVALYPNNEAVNGFFVLDSSKVYTTGSVSVSTDPFNAKTNKFAESKLIEVTCTANFHIKFGTSAITAATTADWPVTTFFKPAYFVIDKDRPYVRVIPNTGSATIFIREIF
jgi:hypothetical protein